MPGDQGRRGYLMSDETQFCPLPQIVADDSAQIAEILADDEDLPATHAARERLAEARRAELADEGCIATAIEVRQSGFRRFLKEADSSPRMTVLAAFGGDA